MINQAIQEYLERHRHKHIHLKAVLFDMDGVLFDSMPAHAKAWHRVMEEYGLTLSEEEAFMHEGRTGASTINIVSLRETGKEVNEQKVKEIYARKSELFNEYPTARPMPGAWETLQQAKLKHQLTTMVVTGSGQQSLLQRLDSNFPGIFTRELMVTAADVRKGKPDPEPYLMALQKAHIHPNEAIVIENAPLGVEAAVAAGIFTIAVNTGPLPDEVLLNQGANLLLPSMQDLANEWETIMEAIKKQMQNYQ